MVQHFNKKSELRIENGNEGSRKSEYSRKVFCKLGIHDSYINRVYEKKEHAEVEFTQGTRYDSGVTKRFHAMFILGDTRQCRSWKVA
ncbi:hypothetical protein HanHA300_Chr01g0009121 [Helianthus annuus]|nr:hypothetical protein HanHA300_Chr01g0009121 [Helianthus annuus]KAJ0626159.1 hypothetical protein HanHA89_Chr01g0009911 [Helianthus annuus]KAJ0782492.1 hypothetical protein HanLR1_Chr01g0008861 [Helianthus annuus]